MKNASGRKTSDKAALRWIASKLAPRAWQIILLMIIYGVLAVCGIYTALAARNAVDSAVSGDRNAVIFYGIVFALVIALQAVLKIVNHILTYKVGFKLENDMAQELFAKLLKKDYQQTSEYHTGELMNRILGDVSVITSAVTAILPQLAYVVVKLIGIFVVLCSVDPSFAAVFAAAGLLVWAASVIFKGRMKGLHKKVQTSNGQVRSFLQEMLQSILVIKAFGAEDTAAERSQGLFDSNYKIKMKRAKITAFSSAGMTLAFSAGYLYALVWGALKIAVKAITYGTFTEVLTLISQIQSPISGLASVFPQYYTAIASAERIMQLEQIPDERENSEIDPEDLKAHFSEIRVERVDFAYSDRVSVLNQADFTLKKGEFAVITGISGIGKSTLMKLMMGVFPPSAGKISVCTDDGRTISAGKSTRPLFAYVPQGNFLVSGTIKENLCFANENAGEELIDRALTAACCGFVYELPQGIMTVIGENGHGLSEGQVQRLAVARALIGGAPVLLLDEATSALDEATEVELINNLRALAGRTCILISHKKAALAVCDKKIEIINGKIVTE